MTKKITERIIDYPPEKLRDFFHLSFEWIDTLSFALKPEDCLENPDEYLSIAKDIFLEMGWYGDGEIQLMWIPPIMFDGIHTIKFTSGIVFWHVKQKEDGISWILSPFNFAESEKQWIVFKDDEEDLQKFGLQRAEEENRTIQIVV